MGTEKFTQGPWIADGHLVKTEDLGCGSYTVAGCHDADIGACEVREANALLIAAAPQMFEALKEAAGVIPIAGRLHPTDLAKIQSVVVAALAAARGEG